MKYLPLFIELKNRLVLVVGGGNVAVRKIEVLQKTGAIIRIVSYKLCIKLQNMLSVPKISWIGQNFTPMMLDTVILVVVATNDSDLRALVYKHAENRHILINTVDDQSKCSCIFPSIIDRDPILIGISSSGTAPMLVRILREKFELLLPVSIGLLAKLAGKWRNRIKQYITNIISRRRFWEKIFYNSNIAMLVEQNRIEEANKYLMHSFCSMNSSDDKIVGSVTLVGAGPGDAGLLTIRGLQMIQQADVILYDYLVSSNVLQLSRKEANKICVGKHLMSQEEINSRMVQLAQQGNRVVRLKGGDPFIFGRGGEELQAISKAGIFCNIVPGITSGIGVAACVGIPLTHRKYAHSVTFITGHCSNNNKLNWNILSDNQQTLVVYMGKMNAINISKNLILHGRNMNTPVAIISRGTCKSQQVVIGNLVELGNLVNMVEQPTLLIIGNVVSLYNQINRN